MQEWPSRHTYVYNYNYIYALSLVFRFAAKIWRHDRGIGDGATATNWSGKFIKAYTRTNIYTYIYIYIDISRPLGLRVVWGRGAICLSWWFCSRLKLFTVDNDLEAHLGYTWLRLWSHFLPVKGLRFIFSILFCLTAFLFSASGIDKCSIDSWTASGAQKEAGGIYICVRIYIYTYSP